MSEQDRRATPKIEDLLAEYADGLIDGSRNAEQLIEKYSLDDDDEAAQLLRLAGEIEAVLVRVAPSPDFVEQLRRELIAEESGDVLTWLRQINTTHLAAGIGGVTVAAGLVWMASRSSAVEKWLRKNGLLPQLEQAENSSAVAS